MRGTEHSFASLMRGPVNRGDVEPIAIDPKDSSRYGYQALYVQDNWKVRPRLMLNMGLRYQAPLARHNLLGQFTSFDPTAPNPRADGIPGALTYAGFGPGRINRSASRTSTGRSSARASAWLSRLLQAR